MVQVDFELNAPWHIARLANYLLINVGPGDSSSEVKRLAAWFTSHLTHRPTSHREIAWHTLDELKTATRWYGPTVFEADFGVAISALPEASESPWDLWSRG